MSFAFCSVSNHHMGVPGYCVKIALLHAALSRSKSFCSIFFNSMTFQFSLFRNEINTTYPSVFSFFSYCWLVRSPLFHLFLGSITKLKEDSGEKSGFYENETVGILHCDWLWLGA